MKATGLLQQSVRAVVSMPAEAAVLALASAFQTTLKAAPWRRRNNRPSDRPEDGDLAWPPEDSRQTPIVLVPGYLSTTACWESLLVRLRQRGYHNITVVQYNSLRMGVPEIAETVAEEASAAARRSGTRGVHLIGYSLGGLAIRYALQFLGPDADALSAITIATPHHGAPLAYAGLGPAAKQMRLKSALLDELPPIDSGGRVRWLLIGGKADLVVPISSATAGGHVASASIPVSGHLNIIDTPLLADTVISHLASCRTGRKSPRVLAS